MYIQLWLFKSLYFSSLICLCRFQLTISLYHRAWSSPTCKISMDNLCPLSWSWLVLLYQLNFHATYYALWFFSAAGLWVENGEVLSSFLLFLLIFLQNFIVHWALLFPVDILLHVSFIGNKKLYTSFHLCLSSTKCSMKQNKSPLSFSSSTCLFSVQHACLMEDNLWRWFGFEWWLKVTKDAAWAWEYLPITSPSCLSAHSIFYKVVAFQVRQSL